MVRSVFIALFVFIAGCQAGGGVIESLDRQSGLTIVADSGLAVFARTQGQLSRSARDYVYLGPVEVNARGVREYFLWVGIASTIDREYLVAESAGPDRLILLIAGEPVEFELAPWDERIPDLAGRSVYDSAVTPHAILAARVTLDQIAMIAGGDIDRLMVTTTDSTTVEYALWQESEWWPGFAAATRAFR